MIKCSIKWKETRKETMMSSNFVRGISIIILVLVVLLTLTVNCDEKPKKSENINNSEKSNRKSSIQIETRRFLYSNAPVLNGIILSAMQTFFQRFGLGFLIDPVLIGILKFLDRIRPSFL